MIDHKFKNDKLAKIANLCEYAINACIKADVAKDYNAALYKKINPNHRWKANFYSLLIKEGRERASIWRYVFEAYKEAVKIK